MDRHEYRRLLKDPAAEELIDLLLYRPAAYVFVKLVEETPLTPNHVTLLSLLAALGAAWEFGARDRLQLFPAALLCFLSNVFDCADGQLARLKHNGTPLGRVVDGAADYAGTAAIFLGVGVGLAGPGTDAWLLVGLAAVSTLVHAMVFDRSQGEYLFSVRGGKNPLELQRELVSSRAGDSGAPDRNLPGRSLLYAYEIYLGLQQFFHRGKGKGNAGPSDPFARRINLRRWSFLGPSTTRTALIVCALAGRVDWYLWVVVIAGNGWLLLLLILRRRKDRRTAPGPEQAGEGR